MGDFGMYFFEEFDVSVLFGFYLLFDEWDKLFGLWCIEDGFEGPDSIVFSSDLGW